MPLYLDYPEQGVRSRNEPDRPRVPVDLIPGREVERPAAAPEVEPEDLSWWTEIAPAAARQGNLLSSTYDRVANYPLLFKDEPGFDPGEHIDGFTDEWRRFVDANSLEEVQFLKDKITAERRDREMLHQAGGVGLATTIGFGLVDPWTAASIALPVAFPVAIGSKAAIAAGTAVKLSRAQRVWAGVAANAALDTAAETAMHSSQELRTISDSLLTIGAGTLLTGAAGAVATRVPKAEFDAVVRAVEEADGTAARTSVFMTRPNELVPKAREVFEPTIVAQDDAWLARQVSIPEQKTIHLAPNGGAKPAGTEVGGIVYSVDPEAFTPEVRAWKELNGKWVSVGRVTTTAERAGRDAPLMLNNIAVTPGVRKSGIARTMMDTLRDALSDRRLDFTRIEGNNLTPDGASFLNRYFGLGQGTSAPVVRTPAVSDSAGSARVGGDTALEDEGVATVAGRVVATTFGKVSPISRVLSGSPSKRARQLVQEIGHVPYLVQKNVPVEQGGKGLPSATSIEDLVEIKTRTRRLAARTKMDLAFAQHKANGGALTHREFSAAVSRELDGIPQPLAPEAASVVQWARKEVFNEDRTRIREIPGYEKFGDDIDADEYFRREYDREKIASDRAGFEDTLVKGFKENPLIPDKGAVEREKLIAARREGVNDATINLEIAEREASEAVRAYETAAADLARAEKAATGREGAQDMAHRGKRTAQAKRREAAKLKRQLDKLNTRLSNLVGEEPPRLEVEIDAELAVRTTRRDEVKKSVTAIRAVGKQRAEAVRKLAKDVRSAAGKAKRMEARAKELLDAGDPKAVKQAELAAAARQRADDMATRLTSDRAQVEELRGQLTIAKKELDDLSDTLFDLRTEKAIGRSKLTAAETLESRRNQKLNRATDAEDELRDAEALAKQLKARAVEARKLARSLKRPAKEARKAKVRAEFRARHAQIPPFDEAEVRQRARDAIENIMGEGDLITPDGVTSSANALKSRKINLPAEMLDPWLVRDFEAVMGRYSRRMVPEIELRARYGSSSLTNEIKAVNEEFQALIADAAGNEKQVKYLTKKREKTVEDLATVLNRVAGRSNVHREKSFARKLIRAGKIVRAYQYVSKLGNQTLSSMSDVGKMVMRYGLPQTMKATAAFLTDWDLARLSLADTRRFGAALQFVSDFRMQQMGDLADEMPITRTDKAVEAVTTTFSRLTLMNKWNSMMQVGSAAMEQDVIARKVMSGRLSPMDVANLRHAGLDDTDLRVLKDMTRHAADDHGLWRLRTELWEDQALAGKIERHIMGVADAMITVRGAGDLPGLMDRELVKTWLQFRTFAIASVNRTLIPLAQGLSLDTAKASQGLASMFALGAMSYYVREKLSGRTPDTSPERLAMEAANWSGTLAYFPDVWDVFSRLHDDIPTFSRFLSRSPSETIFGPTFGAGLNFGIGLSHKLADGTLKQEDLHGLRRAMPFQNLFWISRLFNAIEGELGEQLGAQGARRMDFTDRLTYETPSKELK